MIAAGVRGPALDPSLPPLELRDSLVASRMLWEGADHTSGSPGQGIEWSELAHDLGRARALGVRTGFSPLRRSFHREACEEALGTPTPSAHVSALVSREGRPTVAEAVMLFADLAGPTPPPAKPAAKKPTPVPTGAIAAAGTDTTRHARATAKRTAHRDTLGTKATVKSTAHRDTIGTKPAAKSPKKAPTKAPTLASTKAPTKAPTKASPLSGATATVAPGARPHAADSLHTHARRDTTKSTARRDTLRAAPHPATPTASAADTAS
jgi:hypothetical protein